MLSDEEIVSLNRMKLFVRSSDLSVVTAKDMDIVVTLVEKQSKEIEGLKEDNKKKSIVIIEYQDLYEKLQDKIKAKIEELQEDIKYSANPLSIDNSKFAIKVLQSLLRKEFPVTITKEELEKRWEG